MDIRSIAANDTSPAEVIRFVFDKLIAQGRAATMRDATVCVYREVPVGGQFDELRRFEPIRCGMGHLIADADYTDEIEACPIDEALLMIYGPGWVNTNVTNGMHAVYEQLQKIHDWLGVRQRPITLDQLREQLLIQAEGEMDSGAVPNPLKDFAYGSCLEVLNTMTAEASA